MAQGIKKSGIHALAALLLVAFMATVSYPAFAESGAPFTRTCSSYSTPREFVGDATAFCLSARHQKNCEKLAKAYFNACHFTGKYSKLSSDISRKLLLVMVLNRSLSMKLDPRKS